MVDGLAPLDQCAEQHVAVAHQPDDVLVAVVEHLGDALQVAEQRVELVVAAAMFSDSRETPSRAARNSSGVLRVRSASVFSASASWSVSIRSEVSARPENALTTSYGELVRSTGISRPPRAGPSRPARA